MKIHTLKFRTVDLARFEEIRNGKKSIETRTATERYRAIQKGDILRFTCGKRRIKKTIKRAYIFLSIPAMLRKLPLKKIMPAVNSVAEMRKVYYSYPGYKEKIRKYGLVAFELK